MNPSVRALVGVVAAGLLLAGCSTDSDPVVVTSPSPTASASASTEATASTVSPSSTLTAEEQQAFEEATKVVLAYRQTITDLYSGARTNLNDLNAVATGEKLDQDLSDVQKSLGEGWRYEPEGGQVRLVSAVPVNVDLSANQPQVIVRACLDTTAITDISPTGERSQGIKEALEYSLVRTTYLPAPGWAIVKVSTDSSDPAERRC